MVTFARLNVGSATSARRCRRPKTRVPPPVRANSRCGSRVDRSLIPLRGMAADADGAHRSAPPELHAAYTALEVLVAVVAIVGNSMVIFVFNRDRRLRRRTNYYIVSLAVADFFVGLLGIPFAILASVGLPRNLHACLFTVSLLVVLCTISIFCLVAVSVDRYWAILHPMCYSRNVRTKTAIASTSETDYLFRFLCSRLNYEKFKLKGWLSKIQKGSIFQNTLDPARRWDWVRNPACASPTPTWPIVPRVDPTFGSGWSRTHGSGSTLVKQIPNAQPMGVMTAMTPPDPLLKCARCK
ncbi:Adenosine receptor A2b [Eumeta japonica]|uniref:Adenosine receptor A2b n=1 Tax=Eumeta variegata TaxID=151549 RepID=A0A4C1TIZ8_EUMVA|nr:Adenosine receptor A2b [Eumeta japonica]